MNHLVIATSIILVLWIRSSCLAGSIETVDKLVEVESEFGNVSNAGRYKRKALGLALGTADCQHVGGSCVVHRDKTENPTKVTLVPCCKHLVCLGFGPTEQRNGFGQAHSSSDLHFSGICSLTLDNDETSAQQATYSAYVKGL